MRQITEQLPEQGQKKNGLLKFVSFEEIDETQLWLEIVEELDYLSPNEILQLKSECDELVKVMTKYKFKLSQM